MDVRLAGDAAPRLYLAVGLTNGILMRTSVDTQSGELQADSLTVLCGQKAVRMSKVTIGGNRGMLALSSRVWAGYVLHGRFHLTPLSYDALEYASSFSSEHCPEGIVAVAGNSLRIVAPERLGEAFNQGSVQLRYTPRRAAAHPPSNLAIVVEADHHAYSEALKAQVYTEATIDASKLLKADEEPPDEADDEKDEVSAPLAEAVVGVPRAPEGRWASCVRVVDVVGRKTVTVNELDGNVAALSVATVPFRDMGGEFAIVVGTATHLQLHPRACEGGHIHVFRLMDNGRRLELVHSTPTDDVPYALANFGGRLLAGVGNVLRLYDMGKSRLLRKCETKGLPVMVQSILVASNERIVVGDIAESMHWVRYRAQENTLSIFADEATARHLTATCQLDYNTVAGADKFGNVFVLRLPAGAGADGDEAVLERFLNGAPNKVRARPPPPPSEGEGRRLVRGVGGGKRGGGTALLRAIRLSVARWVPWIRRTSLHGATAHSSGKVLPRLQRPWRQHGRECVFVFPHSEGLGLCHRILSAVAAMPSQADLIAQYHVGDIIVAMQKEKLSAGSTECIVYVTNLGAVGALLPLGTKEEVDTFKHLEMHLRQESPPLLGRDHMMFRSTFYPVKVRSTAHARSPCPALVPPSGIPHRPPPSHLALLPWHRPPPPLQDVTDGDLCEQFTSLAPTLQGTIAGDLDRTPGEVAKKIEDARNRIL